jgi:hypothetical protein
VIRRISFVALALAALTTAACSNPTAPTAKAPKASADVVTDSTGSVLPPPTQIIVQGSGI